jgi:hypothetical protein
VLRDEVFENCRNYVCLFTSGRKMKKVRMDRIGLLCQGGAIVAIIEAALASAHYSRYNTERFRPVFSSKSIFTNF